MRIPIKTVLLLLCLLGGLPAVVKAAAPALIIVLLPGTSLHDWQSADAPHLHWLMQTGALAVMNTRTARQPGQGRETPSSALLTLGAGSRAAGPGEINGFCSAAAAPGTAVSAGALFERRTGQRPHSGQSVCIGWPAVLSGNRHPGYDLQLGSLADTLAVHGFSMKSGGSSGSDWVAAGNAGTVQRATHLRTEAGLCLVWDAGPDLRAADAVINAAAAQAKSVQGRLIVLSPFASDSEYARNERLTPVLLWGPGTPHGLICSPSTRRAGLVTDTDFAPAVADLFGIKRTEFRPLPFGYAWSVSAAPDSLETVERLTTQSVRQADGMRVLPYLAAALAVWMLTVTWLARHRPVAGVWVLAPFAALLSALCAVSLPSFGLLLPGSFALVILLAHGLGQDRALIILTGGTALALAGDMAAGDPQMHRSLLGYSAIEGARYYGIGNEAMGLLLSSALIFSARLWPRSRLTRVMLLGMMAAIVLLLGSAGAKAGGVLVSLAVFGAFLLRVSGRRWTVRTAAFLAAIMAAGMAVAALSDAFLPPSSHSHIGEAVRRIVSSGPSEALDIAWRKLAVEGRLAYHSAWAALLWIGISCTGIAWKHAASADHAVTALRGAGCIGLAACLLLNDAGVVAGAIFVAILWCEGMTQKQSLPAPE